MLALPISQNIRKHINERAVTFGGTSNFTFEVPPFFVKRKPPAVVGFHKGFADEQKANKNSA